MDNIILGLLLLDIILLVLMAVVFLKYRALFRAYDTFMRGKTADSLQDIIFDIVDDIKELKSEDRLNKEAIRELNKNQRVSYQKMGVVKYNAFDDIGGNLSFVLVLLDYTNTGFIYNCVHSRDASYSYVKTIERGKTDVVLGKEEKEALDIALGYNED